MKKKIRLPFEEQPVMRMYHNMAFPTGIIQGNAKEDITPWLCGKCINCLFGRNVSPINVFYTYLIDTWGTADRILDLQRMVLFPDMYRALGYNYVDLLRKMLSLGYYPHETYNEEYIPGKWAYQNTYYEHDFVLIGYDDTRKEFLSAGYLMDGQFRVYPISYENMQKSIETLRKVSVGFNFVHYRLDAKFPLRMDRIVNELSDYISSTTSMKVYTKDRFYGLEAIRQLADYFVETAEEKGRIDPRYTRGLIEQKSIAVTRMKYLCERLSIGKEVLLDRAETVRKMADTVHLLGLKFGMTGNLSVVEHMRGIIEETVRIEEEYLPVFLDGLCKVTEEGSI